MMRRHLAIAAIPLLFVVGCGSDEAPTAETVTVTADAPTGDDEPTSQPEEVASTADQTVDATEAPTEDEMSPTDELLASTPEFSDRGNIIKEVGENAGTGDLQTNEIYALFTVDSIKVDYKCPDAPAPKNGHYLGIEMSIETFPALAESGDVFVDSYSMTILGPDGTRENDSVGNAYQCLSAGEEFPSGIGPGEKASGTIVLDTQHTEGTLILDGSGLGSFDTSWEYQYGPG